MNILITGGTSLLGRSLLRTIPTIDKYKIYATYYGKEQLPDTIFMDLRNPKQISQVFKTSSPDWIIHTAGITNVDFVDKNPELSYEVNVKGTQYIIDECKKYNTKIIYISSNAVFDGENAPYKEEDKINPVNIYGVQKAECEERVKNSGYDYAIVRPVLMYGWNAAFERTNPVTYEIEKLKNSEKLHIVDDIHTQPLYSISCAEASWKIIELNKNGIFHLAGKDILTRFDFAIEIANVFELDKSLIFPVKSEFFTDIAKRPKNTSYITSKMENELGVKPTGVKEGLLAMKNNKF